MKGMIVFDADDKTYVAAEHPVAVVGDEVRITFIGTIEKVGDEGSITLVTNNDRYRIWLEDVVSVERAPEEN